ncbi:MAG: hypothetical protein HEEMFOPI_01126 [Holosporales bacterium]
MLTKFFKMKKNVSSYSNDFLDPDQKPIKINISDRNTKIRLSFNIVKGEFMLTVPSYIGTFEHHSFLKRSQEWMEKQLLKPRPTVPTVVVSDGRYVSLLGKKYKLHCIVDIKKNIIFKDNDIEIYGPPSSFAITFEENIKHMLHRILSQRCYVFAKSVARDFKKITLKETKTRWGSCSSEGNLNFSWRLVFAPNDVVNYLCAHEVAHLVEMNHSVRFWSIVKALHPNFEEAKNWLKNEGKKLLYITITHDKKRPETER